MRFYQPIKSITEIEVDGTVNALRITPNDNYSIKWENANGNDISYSYISGYVQIPISSVDYELPLISTVLTVDIPEEPVIAEPLIEDETEYVEADDALNELFEVIDSD